LAIALVVFLLAGVNAAVAASSAAIERRRETALRLALGAAPTRLARDAGVQVALTVGLGLLLAIVVPDAFITAILSAVPDAWLARVPGGAGAVRLEAPRLSSGVKSRPRMDWPNREKYREVTASVSTSCPTSSATR
jgi:hypothetical protein